MDNRDYFGSIFKRARKLKGYSQRKLAKEIGVNYTYISKIENGKEKPSQELLEVVAEKLNLDKNVFIIASGQMPKELENFIITRPQLAVEMVRAYKNGIDTATMLELKIEFLKKEAEQIKYDCLKLKKENTELKHILKANENRIKDVICICKQCIEDED